MINNPNKTSRDKNSFNYFFFEIAKTICLLNKNLAIKIRSLNDFSKTVNYFWLYKFFVLGLIIRDMFFIQLLASYLEDSLPIGL